MDSALFTIGQIISQNHRDLNPRGDEFTIKPNGKDHAIEEIGLLASEIGNQLFFSPSFSLSNELMAPLCWS